MYLSIFSGSSISELKQFRKDLSQDITDVVNKYGIQLFPDDFNLLEEKGSTKEPSIVDEAIEEMKTQELRNRRNAKKLSQKTIVDESDSGVISDSDVSAKDILSDTTSESASIKHTNSYTNIPMFSDYDLHMNAKNSQIDIKKITGSVLSSTTSMIDDYGLKIAHTPVSLLSQEEHVDGSPVEINFSTNARNVRSAEETRKSLSEKIKDKVRKNRDKNE